VLLIMNCIKNPLLKVADDVRSLVYHTTQVS